MSLIKELQRAVGVADDGVYGPATHSAVMARLGVNGNSHTPPSDTFTRALAVILRHEGGFVNHPKDPGGMTNLGVTRATWEAWTGKPATETDMRALTPETVAPVYRKNYWDKLRCDDLPPALALCVFDFGVNAGPARAARYLQKLVGTAQDGVVGPQTVEAVKGWSAAEAVRLYQESRRSYYRSLSTFATFGRGWLRRVDEVEQEAREWL